VIMASRIIPDNDTEGALGLQYSKLVKLVTKFNIKCNSTNRVNDFVKLVKWINCIRANGSCLTLLTKQEPSNCYYRLLLHFIRFFKYFNLFEG